MKSAFHDPNPVVMLEHKGLYWSKIHGTENAKSIEPDKDYILPLGKARIVIENTEKNNTICIVTYGMGFIGHKALLLNINGKVEIIDLRTLVPCDEELIYKQLKNMVNV